MPSKHEAIEYERGVLGYILHMRKMQNIFGLLNREDFIDERHQVLYDALSQIASSHVERTIDEAVVMNFLRDNQHLESAGGPHYIVGLINEAALETNLNHYLTTIREKAMLRQIEAGLTEVQLQLNSAPNLNVDYVVEEIEKRILAPVRMEDQKEFQSVAKLSKKTIETLENKRFGTVASGLLTNYGELDNLLGGIQRGDLFILAARPSMGKTAFALNIAINVAKTENVAFFSVEMDAYQIVNRIYAIESLVEGNKIMNPKWLTPNDEKKLYLGVDAAEKLKLFINDTAGIKLADLVWRVKNLHRNNPLSLIIIDYLQLVTLTDETRASDNRQLEVAQISRTLKKLARELNVPIIALSQLSRRVEQRESKIPMLSDLRESGAIEQDADIIAFLYREDYYKREEEKTIDETQRVSVIVSKHRNGATGTVALAFEPRYGAFTVIDAKDFS